MKLISLNTWGGKYFDPLKQFIKQHSKDTDIFCLQEVYNTQSKVKEYKKLIRTNLLNELKNILSDFQVFYFPILFGYDDQPKKVSFDLECGIAIFVKKAIKVTDYKNYFIYKDNFLKILKDDFSNLTTPLQYISFNLKGVEFTVFNFHGASYPPSKLDSKNRLIQSRKVKEILNSKKRAIIVGDFNLLPETESLKILGENMKNLIAEYKILRTRSKLSPYFGKPDFQEFADYILVTPDVLVNNFKVPEVKISDHLPMILEFG